MEDLVGLIEDYGAAAFPFNKKRREELTAADEAKREGRKLEELLTHQGRNHFGAHWSAPCRAFTSKLIEGYEELITSGDQDFEIILVSIDRDLKEFELNTSSMPWLAIPYQDKTRQDLCGIFDIKVIPALVLIGPDGKAISTNGKAMISLYGAKAFSFTESRIKDLEAALRNEGEALPPQVKDLKHEHMLELEMAKAYACDYYKKQGRFWPFSCGVCDYDLHPNCVEKSFVEMGFTNYEICIS
ncbi:hypothetical protein ACFXTN_015413 [Malus domestica]